MIAVDSVAAIVIAVLGTGGIAGAIVALLRFRPEAGQMTVNTAQGVLIMQTTVLDQLQEENRRLRDILDDQAERIHALEKAMGALAEAQGKIAALEHERDTLRAQLAGANDRIDELERQINGRSQA